MDLQDYSAAHAANIATHVIAGVIALLLGLAQLATNKGGTAHRWIGRLFLGAFAVVIATAAVGVFLFEFRAFLSVIALLAAYQAISGRRVLTIRRTGLAAFDVGLSLIGLGAVAAFAFAVSAVDYPWDDTVIYSTLAWLALIAGYDLLRIAMPRRMLEATWIYEHLTKMIGALAALASAFAATLAPQWAPWSQLGPSALGVALIIFFALRVGRRAR